MSDTIKEKIKYILLLISISSFAYGIYSGEMEVVLGKAIKVCLECCGIG